VDLPSWTRRRAVPGGGVGCRCEGADAPQPQLNLYAAEQRCRVSLVHTEVGRRGRHASVSGRYPDGLDILRALVDDGRLGFAHDPPQGRAVRNLLVREHTSAGPKK